MNIRLLPYKKFSKSARDLVGLLEAIYLNPEVDHLVDGTVINWGNSQPKGMVSNWINSPAKIRISNNKLLAFQKLKEHNVSIPDFTTSTEEAQAWVNNGHLVFARTKLSGHSGDGIVVCDANTPIPNAPLLVKYVKKAAEYRVHVAFGEVIDEQAKRKRKDFNGEVSNQIRSHQNGWVYCRKGFLNDGRRNEVAIASVAALGLDFGAVDIIYNQKKDQYYVLEVNTAPGLEGETLFIYFNTFYSYLNHV
jgi:glutathione synthase/RimK-type ligase-like ATP-grasp enzyme